MKFLNEYRDAEVAAAYARALERLTTRPWTIMEVCGGQTHSIVKFGVDALLPREVTLVHGPGCPVCVTPVELLDKAMEVASRPEVILCSFGDMLRVPGTARDLFSVKAAGADVRVVYSPIEAVGMARGNPAREVVFFAVGFETTAPANAMAVIQAHRLGLRNFSLLVAHVLVPPAMEAILSSASNRVQGFLAPGHVCTVMGFSEYERIAEQYRVPIVVTGFEPVDILQGLHMCIKQLEEGRTTVANQYSRSVRREGNAAAQAVIRDVFRVCHRRWRGLGEIPQSGLALQEKYSSFDAEERFGMAGPAKVESSECQSGLILQGALRPEGCSAFGTRCTPEHPLGAPMVSSEGACAAYYRYRLSAAGNPGPTRTS